MMAASLRSPRDKVALGQLRMRTIKPLWVNLAQQGRGTNPPRTHKFALKTTLGVGAPRTPRGHFEIQNDLQPELLCRREENRVLGAPSQSRRRCLHLRRLDFLFRRFWRDPLHL